MRKNTYLSGKGLNIQVNVSSFQTWTEARLPVHTDGSTTTATFTCDVGYTMSGSANLACRSDGGWNVTQPTCSM
ncbi:hypothetical protein DPMN_114004 [Dreissena polymorpha]|uniref:Sushi domain-containing protein n=1 Tax=Dreissena polymorpha TaxID=45954 RepID=A0A9D4QRB6_DREPO|nr:hypothetical protein DPMN_114004 [Dreissena polymorpha]